MEGTVTMTLSDYDALKDRIRKQEQRAIEAETKLESIQIFRFETSYDGSLTVKFEPDSKKYLDKAFAKHAGGYDIKKSLKDECIWNFAAPKAASKIVPLEPLSEETTEVIF